MKGGFLEKVGTHLQQVYLLNAVLSGLGIHHLKDLKMTRNVQSTPYIALCTGTQDRLMLPLVTCIFFRATICPLTVFLAR